VIEFPLLHQPLILNDATMTTKRYSEGKILSILEEADKGASSVELCRKHGVSTDTLDAWRHKYGIQSELRRALYRKNRQLDELQEVAGLGSWELDLSTKEANWTRQMYFLLGYEDGEVAASPKNFLNRIHEDDRERAREELDRPFQDFEQTYNAEFRLVMPDGQIRHVAERGQIIKGEDGKPARFVGTTLDISKRKQAEKEKEDLRTQLAHAQKMESVGRLAGGVAHDFNNLLAVIIGNLSLFADKLDSGSARTAEEIRSHIEPAIRAAERGSELTHRLLAVSRRQTLEPKVLNIDAVIRSMEDLLRRTLGQEIELQLAAFDWLAEIDESQFENALLNLIVNARDAMPEGGTLTIKSGQTILSDDFALEHPEIEAGEYLTVAVSDTGCGMDARTLEKVFEPFYTTKDVGRGTGLGLSMVFGFVTQSNGHVVIDSEPGAGTTVKLFLPRTRATRNETAAAPHQADPGRSSGEVILLVEDDDSVRHITKQMLESLGYNVIEAANGKAALDVLDDDDRIDLVLTDVAMPGGMCGPDVAIEARKRRPGLKVLFMSGHSENATLHDFQSDTNASLLSKPFSRIELGAKLQEVLS